MNKNLHRIIFNALRGLRMVVAETARCGHQGGAAGGTRASRRKGASPGNSEQNRPLALVDTDYPAINVIVTLTAALTSALFLLNPAQAQIKADTRAPGNQQATILTTANGAPQVNIQTPSSGGVSRNVYTQFDVQANGVVLNNSRTGAPSVVGGYVQANPWLAQGSARIILNEVNSTSASQLQGPIEVAGQRAEVVIANPAGISVNGGSFINASAVTLTTGTPVLSGGALDAYRVQGGMVSVSGHGLDSSGADYTNILARAVQVNAGIWASDLRVITGNSTLSASDPVASAKAAAASTPTNKVTTHASTDAPSGSSGFALDVSALGGMYAGKIFMIGTESGMGVRNGGALAASAGDIVLSNNGWLSNSGSMVASGNTRITTQGSQTHSGITAAQGNLTLSAGGAGSSITATDTSTLAAGLKSDGTLITGGGSGSGGNASLSATQDMTLGGKLIATGDLQVQGSTVNLSGAQIQADSATIAGTSSTTTGGADLHADNSKIYVAQTLTLTTGQTLYTAGATIVARQLKLGAHDIINTGGTIGQSGSDDLQIAVAGTLDNGNGHIAGGGNVQLSSSSLTNADKGSVYAAGELNVTTGRLSNAGSLYAGGDLNLQVDNSLSNTGPGGLIASGANTTITAASLTNGTGANIIAGLQSDGKLFSGPASGAPHLSITTSHGLHNQGNLSAAGELTLKGNGSGGSGDLDLGGSTYAGGNIGVYGDSIAISGTLVTAKDLEVQAKSGFSIGGTGQVGGSANVNTGGSFNLGGQFTVNKDLNLSAGGIATTPGSFLMVGHNATLSGGAGVSLGGATTVGNRLALSGASIELIGTVDAATTAVSGGTITLGETGVITHWKGNLSLSMSGDVNAKGGLSVADSASISSGGAIHIGGDAQSGGNLELSASGNLQVEGSVSAGGGTALSAGGTLETLSVQATSVSLDGQQVNVTGSVVGSAGATHLRGTNGIVVTGDVISAGASGGSGSGSGGVVATTGGALDIGGVATSSGAMTLQAGTTIHLSQQTQSTGSMHLNAGGNITADQGLAAGAMDIQAQNLTVAQNLTSGGALQAQTHAFNVAGNVLSGGDTLIVAAPQVGAIGPSTVQIGGALATTGALTVHSSGTLQVASSTQADGSLQLTAQGITLGGKTTSGGNSNIDAQGAALNVAGLVGSGGNQSLAGTTITVQGAQAMGSMSLSASGGAIDSSSSLLAGTGLAIQSNGATGAITVQGHIASDGATTLHSTGQVTATGTIASGAGGLTVDAGGDIAAATLQSLGNSQLTSGANVTLGNALNIGSYTVVAGGNISQAQVQAGAGLTETAGGGITHTGATLVQGDASLISGGAQTLGNTPASGLIATANITATAATGSISVGADLLANGTISTTATQGAIAVGGNLATLGSVGATAQNGITVGGALAGQSATLGSSAGGVQIASNVQVQTDLNVTAQTNVQAGGTTVAGGTLNASSTSGSVAFNQDLSVGSTTTITAGNGITLGGNSNLVGAAQLQSTGGTISNNGVLATNQTLTVGGNADLLNHGSLQSIGDMNLAAHNITSNAGAPSAITTGGALTANASGTVNLDNGVSVTAKTTITLGAAGGGSNAGTIQAGDAISLSGGSLANSGQIASQTVSSSGGISNSGTVYGSNTVAVSGATSNSGQIVATNSVNLGSTSNSGVIQSQTVSLGATSNSGSVSGNTVSASSLSNQGTVGANGDISIAGDVYNSAAIAANNITFSGSSLVNSGQVHASGNISISVGSITNTAEVTPPPVGVPEDTTIPYANSGAIKADGQLTISGGSLSNTGTLSSNGNLTIGMTGSVANNKRGFILGGSTITVAAGSVTNDGIVYGLGGAPSTITINASGGFSNGSTGVLIAGSQLNITASSFSNAGDNVSAGVGSLGDASLSTTGVWDAGSNPLRVNGLLTAATNGITVDVGKTWEQSNVTWSGVLLNYGSTNLGIGNGAVINQSSGVTTFTTAPDPIALADTYAYNTNAPSGYTGATLVGYTDVTNRARFTAGAFTGSFVNVAGDISGNITAVGGGANIDQVVIWSGVPVATPAAPAEEVSVASASLPRAFLTATSVITLASPGTIEGGTVTVNAGDLTVDHSNTGAAQGGIASAQGLSVGSINASPAVLALLQNPALLTAAALQATAPHPSAQGNAIASGTVTTTVGASAPTGTASSFATNPNAGGGSSSGEGGTTLSLPAPDLSTVQGAWAALVANQLKPITTDWAALSARGSSGLTSDLSPISQAPSSTATIKTDTSSSALAAGVWVQRDSQGLAQINSAAVLLAQQKAKAQREADAALRDPTLITITGGTLAAVHGDLAIDATGQLTLTNTQVRAKEGVAHIHGSQGVTIAATQTAQTSTRIDGQIQTLDHAAVAGGVDSEAQAATTVVVGGSVTTTTRTTSEWGTSSVDAKQIDIQSGKGSVTIDSSDLTASNGIRISAAQDVNILAQRGTDTQSSSTANASQQQVGGSWDGGGTLQLVTTTTTDGDTTTQETLRTSNLDAGSAQLSIEARGGNITGQSAQLAGDKIVLVTGTPDADGHRQGGGSIDLQSLQVAGKTVEQANNAEWSAMTTQTLTTIQGSMTAANGITLSANKDVALTAIAVNGGTGNVVVQATGNITLGANADAVQTNQTHNGGGSSFWTTTNTTTNYQTQDVNAAVTSIQGNDITLKAGDTLTNYAAEIGGEGSGTVLQIAGNDAKTYTATQSRSATEDSKSSTSFLGMVEVGHDNSTTTALNSEELGSKIFGNQVGIKAKNVEIVGANVVAKDLLSITATDSVSITAATNTFTTKHDEDKSMLGISAGIGSGVSLNSSNSTLNTSQTTTTSSASTISGNNVVITSGGDTTVTASTVVATKDVNIAAGGDVNILAATNTDTTTSQSTSNDTSIGLMGGVSARQTLFSHTTTAGNSQATTTTATTSVLSANEGTLSIVSGGKLTTQGAELLALDGVDITAKSVDLQAVTDASSSANHFESSSITVGAALAGTVGSKITAISDTLQIANTTSNERLKGAATLKAGYDAYKLANGGVAEGTKAAADTQKALTKAGEDPTKADPNSGSAFGVSFSVGINSTKQDSSSATTQNRGTSIQANTINITATEGDITATAAKLQGANISLDAKKDITLLAAVNTADIQSSNESHNLGAGVTIGLGQQSGISFQLNAGQANGNTNGSETTFDNTLITATNTLTVKSGNNTNLVGAQLAGDKVKMDVGGDLNVVTLQDTSNFASEQHSSGINLSLCIPPLCYGNMVTGSVSKSDSTIDHNYKSATGQSGIAAGAGGYDITVKGNTDLVGGAITSKAPTEQNSLKTGSLTYSDLANNQSTNSSSSSMSLGYNGGSAMSTLVDNAKTNALTALAGGAGMPANGSSSGVTQSVIGNGTVTITGTGDATKDANSATQVATLTSRDPSKANGALTNTLTLQQAQKIPGEQQTAAENTQIATMVGSVAFNVVGDIAKANGWAESSPQKIALHTIAGFVTVAASGGNGATGAVAAGANELVTSTVNDIVDAAIPMPANATPEQARQVMADRKSLMEAAATVVGVGAVAVTGGSSQEQATGGNVALIADKNNRQLHPDEAKLIKNNAASYARQRFGVDSPSAAQVDQAQTELTQQSLRQIDSSWAQRTTDNPQASNFLAQLAQTSGPANVGGGTLFDARGTAAFTNHTINATSLPQTAPLYNLLDSTNVKGVAPNVRGAYVAYSDANNDPNLNNLSQTQIADIAKTGTTLHGQAKTPQEANSITVSAGLGRTHTTMGPNGIARPGDGSMVTDLGTSSLATAGLSVVGDGTPASGKMGSTGKTSNVLPTTTSEFVPAANGATGVLAGTPIPANSANAGVGLRSDLSIQAGVPTSTSNVWGASLDDLKQAFNTSGATITPGSARASSSGNAQILNVEGSSTGVVQVQYSPASTATTKTSHGGQYYKFTYADGTELKVIDPATYRVLGWPENGGKTTFQNPSGKVITFDPITKTWR